MTLGKINMIYALKFLTQNILINNTYPYDSVNYYFK